MDKLTQAQLDELREAACEAIRFKKTLCEPWSEMISGTTVTLRPETLLALLDMIPVLRPIEEAPEDGTPVVALLPNGVRRMAKSHGQGWWSIPGMWACYPTHFIDLSTLPTPEGE